MLEKAIELKFVKAVKARGGIALKLVCPGFAGMPDRIVLMPGGRVCFVELKSTGKRPRPLQLARHRILRLMGFRVFVIDDEKQIGGMLDEV